MSRVSKALFALALLVAYAVGVGLVDPHRADALDWSALGVAPLTHGHVLGTDRLGRDVLVRSGIGLATSLALGLAGTALSLVIGGVVGALAALARRPVGDLVMRGVDALDALPYPFVAILAATLAPRGPATILLVTGSLGWLGIARVVRLTALGVVGQGYVRAARVAGVSTARILARHVVPACAATALVYATLTLPTLIGVESFLSFLGLGVAEPSASLGNLLADGANEMDAAPWLLIVPATLLVATIRCLMSLGETLSERFGHDGR